MMGCLVLYHRTITSLTKIMILRAMFHEEDFEIHVVEAGTVIMYLWNVDKESVLQAALNFETANINTGFGFGDCKKDALKQAKMVLSQSTKISTTSWATAK